MNIHRLLVLPACLGLLAALAGCAQPSAVRLDDPYGLTEPKGFTAHRVSSNNPDWNSNDDSKRPIPGETTVLADLISSVAFWYQEGIARDQPPVPYGAARLPQGNAQQIEAERSLAECVATDGKASLSPELFWSKDVILFEGQGKGAKLEVPFEVSEDGDYEVYTEVAQAADYGIYTVLLDGKPPQAPQLEHEPGADERPQTQFDGYAPETYVGLAHQVGWVRLTKGRHALTFVCLGKREASGGYHLGVDNIVLAKTGREAWAAAAKTTEPRIPRGNVAELGKTLTSDPDPVTRGLAAVALRDQGKTSLAALPALMAGLKDVDVCVRMMSANALATIGQEAAPAASVLIAAGSVKDEQVHVLRAVATALGNIGRPAATPALPLLRELAKIPRVRWAAELAIRKLE